MSVLILMCFRVCSKLKELSKRTTFIRVTQQINEVFGSAPPATHSSQMPKPTAAPADNSSA
jgi:hypothetical protein